jgi:hypothetical protein
MMVLYPWDLKGNKILLRKIIDPRVLRTRLLPKLCERVNTIDKLRAHCMHTNLWMGLC